jgi:hypothetical protein
LPKAKRKKRKEGCSNQQEKNYFEKTAKDIADKYTIVLKGTNAYIKFLNLNELEKYNIKKIDPSNQNR